MNSDDGEGRYSMGSNVRPKVYGYVRSASADRAAVERQTAIVSSYAATKNFSVERIYVDNGVSGTTVAREGLGALIETLRTEKGGVVIVESLDRLARSPSAWFAIQDDLRQAEATVIDLSNKSD